MVMCIRTKTVGLKLYKTKQHWTKIPDCLLLVAKLLRSPARRHGMTSRKTWYQQNHWPHFVASSRHTCSEGLFLDINWLSPVDQAVVPLLRPPKNLLIDWLIDWSTSNTLTGISILVEIADVRERISEASVFTVESVTLGGWHGSTSDTLRTSSRRYTLHISITPSSYTIRYDRRV